MTKAVCKLYLHRWLWRPYFCCGCSVAKSCPTLCSPTHCSMLGFLVLHCLLELLKLMSLSQWFYLITSSSVALFSSCLQSLPASGSFLMSQLFTSGGQRIGASASASVFPMNIQGWFPLGLTGSISLLLGHYIRNTERETTDFIHYTTLFKLYKNLVE